MGVEKIDYPINLQPIVDELKTIKEKVDKVELDVALVKEDTEKIKEDVQPKLEPEPI